MIVSHSPSSIISALSSMSDLILWSTSPAPSATFVIVLLQCEYYCWNGIFSGIKPTDNVWWGEFAILMASQVIVWFAESSISSTSNRRGREYIRPEHTWKFIIDAIYLLRNMYELEFVSRPSLQSYPNSTTRTIQERLVIAYKSLSHCGNLCGLQNVGNVLQSSSRNNESVHDAYFAVQA